MKFVHAFPNVTVKEFIETEDRLRIGVVAATVGAFQRLRQDCRVPLDVYSLEFVSAVVAGKGYYSSNHGNSVLQVQRYRKDVSKDVRGKNIFTSHRKIFTHPMSMPSKAPSHTMARSSLFITCRMRASVSFISISLMRSRTMVLMSMLQESSADAR